MRRQLQQHSTDALRILQIMVHSRLSSTEHTHSNTNQEQSRFLRKRNECGMQDKTTKENQATLTHFAFGSVLAHRHYV